MKLFPFMSMIAVVSCSGVQTGPPSIIETSAARTGLAERIGFIEQYVKFRRKYEKLDYAVVYQNNGGGLVPGPSGWDIRLVAVVPASELDSWIPADARKTNGPALEWVQDLPGMIERRKITEWYRKSGIEVGLDRTQSVVVYRNASTPD
ncbi:MAG: hypothetical protein NTV55_09130 [Planctomycetota bacterium]|nr:hypothetical protein [Planctomycetota bacterium]